MAATTWLNDPSLPTAVVVDILAHAGLSTTGRYAHSKPDAVPDIASRMLQVRTISTQGRLRAALFSKALHFLHLYTEFLALFCRGDWI